MKFRFTVAEDTLEMTSPFDDLSLDDSSLPSRDTSYDSSPSATTGVRDSYDYEQRESYRESYSYDDVDADDSYAEPARIRQDSGIGLPEFAYTSAHQRRRSRLQDQRARDDRLDDYGQRTATSSDRDYDDYDDYDDFDDPYDDDRASAGWRRGRPNNKMRRIIFYAILVAVIVICIIALIKLLTKKDKPTDTTPSITPIESENVITPQTDPKDTEATETTAPDPSETEPSPSVVQGEVTHTIVAGDSWWSLCMQYYNAHLNLSARN